MTEELKLWCLENHLILSEIEDALYLIKGTGHFLFVNPTPRKLVGEGFSLILSEEQENRLSKGDIEYVLFQFGGRFYYSPVKVTKREDVEVELGFNDFKNLGEADQVLDYEFVHLGVHTEYEMMNGTHSAKDWAKRAKFLKYEHLGICDRNTLAGVLLFQKACTDEGIKPILGETISVLYKKDEIYDLKLFVVNSKGWRNLLHINKYINVENDGKYIKEKELLKHCKGLVCVLDRESIVNKVNLATAKKYIRLYKKLFEDVYYQFDTVMFNNLLYDKPHLESQKRYLNDLSDIVEPVLLNDSYYLDKEQSRMRAALNKIDGKAQPDSTDQYFKILDESEERIRELFPEDKVFPGGYDYYGFLSIAIENSVKIAEKCEFIIPTGTHRLPKFPYKGDNGELFRDLLAEGWQKKIDGVIEDDRLEEYFDRMETEMTVIMNAGFVDYFLIMWDIIKWAKEQGIIVGNARGSVAGSLVSYLLDITTVDPIPYNLLFERFLNETRVSGERAKAADALPDIDVDFSAERRDEVKQYIEDKYGAGRVCSIGTYTKIGLKGGLKDFNRVMSDVAFNKMNYVTSHIESSQRADVWDELFQYAQKSTELKEFIQNHRDLVNYLKFALGQPRASSIHASAVVVVPKTDEEGNEMTIFDWMPVRKIVDSNGEEHLVSEWEGKSIDLFGFLKLDILGLKLLDRFDEMLRLIKSTSGDSITLEDIPLDDSDTLKLFQRGWNESIFQFGSQGLKMYTRALKPDNIEELIAATALYRPGPMSSNAHTHFLDIKFKKRKVEYDLFCEEVTKPTHGLYVYQEQMMQAVVAAGDFTLVESDILRTAIKKFQNKVMAKYKDQFIRNYVRKLTIDNPKSYAEKVWYKLYKFSDYAFNRSHSTAYTIMGFWQQWFKAHYPLVFYTVALRFAHSSKDSVDIPNILMEIRVRKLGISVQPPDVNHSDAVFTCNPKTNNIYWSLRNIKNLGDIATKKIVAEREANGEYHSIDDFRARMKGKNVSKRVIESMIIAGSFDSMYELQAPIERYELLRELYRLIEEPMPDEYKAKKYEKNYSWTVLQNEYSGFGEIDYKELVKSRKRNLVRLFVDAPKIGSLRDRKTVVIAGQVHRITERKYGKGKNQKLGEVILRSNFTFIYVLFWAEPWVKFKSTVNEARESESILLVSGKIQTNTYKNQKQIVCNEFSNVIGI